MLMGRPSGAAALPSGPPRPAAQTGSWEERNKAPGGHGRRSPGATGAGRPRPRRPAPRSSGRASSDPRRGCPALDKPPPPARALAPPGPRGSGFPKGRAAGRRGRVCAGVRREGGRGSGGAGCGGGGRAREEAEGGAGGGGAPGERTRAGTDCHPAAISLCHGSGLLATATSPAAPSRAPPRAALHAAEPGAPPQPHKEAPGGGEDGSPRRRDAARGGPDTSWKLLEMAPARAPAGAASLGRALAPAGPLSCPRAPRPAGTEKVSPCFLCVARALDRRP